MWPNSHGIHVVISINIYISNLDLSSGIILGGMVLCIYTDKYGAMSDKAVNIATLYNAGSLEGMHIDDYIVIKMA